MKADERPGRAGPTPQAERAARPREVRPRGSRAEFTLWPWALALALAAMIGVSLTVLGIAIAHPDAQVVAHPLARPDSPPRAAH